MGVLKEIKRPVKALIKAAIYPIYEARIYSELDFSQTPHHIGVILDGNRRWSKENPALDGDVSTIRGHKAGADKIIDLLDWCEESQVKVLTIWLLSNQNLARPATELEPLLEIIGETVSIAHQGPAFQNHEAGEDGTERGGDRSDQQRVLHEGILKRLQEVHTGAVASRWARARRRLESRPCFGAKRNAARKTMVCSVTMQPPVAPLKK